MTEKTTRREDDYRDYEERDLRDGWPYADELAGSKTEVGNGPYDGGDQAFDETGNPGFQTADETAEVSSPVADIPGEDPISDTDDDAVEEAIAERLEAHDVDASGFEIKVTQGVVELTGEVETAEERKIIEYLVSQTPDVTAVHNGLATLAVDSGFPADTAE